MIDKTRIAEIAAEVAKTSPIPETLDDLDAQSRRRIERQAAELGRTPEAHYADIVTRAKAERDDPFDPDAIARSVRR